MSEEKIIELSNDFQHYLSGQKSIPEKFLNNDPLRRFAHNEEILELYEKYKKGPVDPMMVVPKEHKVKKQEHATV